MGHIVIIYVSVTHGSQYSNNKNKKKKKKKNEREAKTEQVQTKQPEQVKEIIIENRCMANCRDASNSCLVIGEYS